MAQQAATQDEDLLIISDDNDAEVSLEDSSIEISLDNSSDSEVSETEEVISFDTPTEEVQESNTEVSVEDASTEVSQEPITDITSDLDLGLTDSDESNTEVSVEETSTEEVAPVEALDLSLDETPTEEVAAVESDDVVDFSMGDDNSSSTTEQGGMNAILAETIAKLESRKVSVGTEKDGKHAQVADIDAQIKALQEEKVLHEGEIEELEAEEKKIVTNIKGLEKMKLDEDVAKEHNSKRIPKK